MSGRRGATTTTTTTSTPTPTTGSAKKTSLGSSPNNASACLRLQSDLRSIRVEPPEVRKGTHNDECVSPEKKREHVFKSFLVFVSRFGALLSFPSTPDAIVVVLLSNRTNEHEQGCSASPHSDDNLFVWSATICGPQDSPWEGGIFSLRLTFSDAYPATAPRVRFVSEMFHPNIYPDGTLCMDTIQDQWSPVHSVASLLTSVRSLLCDPNVNSPANPQAAKMFVEEEKEYNKRVRRLARKTVE